MKKKASGNYELHSTFKTKAAHGSVGVSTNARQSSRIQTYTNTNNANTNSSGGESKYKFLLCFSRTRKTPKIDFVS